MRGRLWKGENFSAENQCLFLCKAVDRSSCGLGRVAKRPRKKRRGKEGVLQKATSAARPCAPGGRCPPGPPDAGVGAVGGLVERGYCGVGSRWDCGECGAFWGMGHRGWGVLAVPNAALYGGIGGLSVFGTWAPPHCCGSWLRPKLLPPIGSSLGRMRVWLLLLCPFAFWSLWAGNQVTGATEDRGCRG